MLHFLTYIILVLTLVLSLKRLSWGVAIMLASHTLLPPIARVGGVSLNTALIAILTALCGVELMKNQNLTRELNVRCGFPLYRLHIPLLMLGILGTAVPFAFQFHEWSQFLITEILPFYIILVAVRNANDFYIVVKTFSISYFIIGIYGIMTYFWKMNPMFMLFALEFDFQDDIYTGDGSERVRAGLNSSASGNLSGPLPWGQFSLVALFIALYLPNIKNKSSRFVFILLAALNCFFSAKRSVILPMLVILAFYCIQKRIFFSKRILYTASLIIVSFFVLSSIKVTQGYMANIETAIFFWDDKLADKYDVGGSSKEMRTNQLEYAIGMVKDAPIQGLGYAYPAYYVSKNGSHPFMLGFESLIYQALVPSGIIGIILWLSFFSKAIIISSSRLLKRKTCLAIHGAYILSLLLTGIQSSFYMYLIMVALMYRYNTITK